MSFFFLVLFFHFIGWLELPEDFLQIAVGWCLLAWFGGGLALFLGALSESHETVEKLWHPLSYLLFPLSGAAFLVDALPEAAQNYALLLPMVNATEYIREGYFGSAMIAHYDLGYTALVNTMLTLLGLAEVRKVSARVIPE